MEYKIIKEILAFPKNSRKWHKEINIIQWGNNPQKYDLRGWNDDHTEMTKGVTLSEEEYQFLKDNL